MAHRAPSQAAKAIDPSFETASGAPVADTVSPGGSPMANRTGADATGAVVST